MNYEYALLHPSCSYGSDNSWRPSGMNMSESIQYGHPSMDKQFIDLNEEVQEKNTSSYVHFGQVPNHLVVLSCDLMYRIVKETEERRTYVSRRLSGRALRTRVTIKKK